MSKRIQKTAHVPLFPVAPGKPNQGQFEANSWLSSTLKSGQNSMELWIAIHRFYLENTLRWMNQSAEAHSKILKCRSVQEAIEMETDFWIKSLNQSASQTDHLSELLINNFENMLQPFSFSHYPDKKWNNALAA